MHGVNILKPANPWIELYHQFVCMVNAWIKFRGGIMEDSNCSSKHTTLGQHCSTAGWHQPASDWCWPNAVCLLGHGSTIMQQKTEYKSDHSIMRPHHEMFPWMSTRHHMTKLFTDIGLITLRLGDEFTICMHLVSEGSKQQLGIDMSCPLVNLGLSSGLTAVRALCWVILLPQPM